MKTTAPDLSRVIPSAAPVVAGSIPDDLKTLPHWVCWRYVNRDGKETKLPIDSATGQAASSTNPSTWGDFERALRYYGARKTDGIAGIGFVLTNSPFAGIDLDHCRDPETGAIQPWAEEVIEKVGTYAEVSVSGTGVHLLAKGDPPKGGKRKGAVEMYSEGRFFTVTGDRLRDRPGTINECTGQLAAIHRQYIGQPDIGQPVKTPAAPVTMSDQELIDTMMKAVNGAKIRKLFDGEWEDLGYPSQSEGDMSFCCHLAFYTGKDGERMDRLFRASGLFREKWDKKHHGDGSTYGQETIRRAIERTGEIYRASKPTNGGRPNTEVKGHDKRPSPDGALSSAEILDALGANEDGDARLFAMLHRGRLVYDHSAGRWYIWAGHFWREDLVNEAMRGVDAVVDLYVGEVKRQAWERAKCAKAGQTEDAKRHEDNEEGLCKRIRSLQTVFRMSNVLKLASAGADRLGITGLEWDLDPWLLPCANGVIDLRSGKLRPGRPEDFVKTVAPVPWTGIHTPAPAWEKFLDAVFDGDDDLIAFVQRLMGYAITGLTSLHLLPILWGIGSNGKTTLVEALAHVLGPLAGQIGSEMILEQRNPRQSGAPTSDVMALRAKRLVCARETNEGRRLDPGRLKLLTGRDTLEGREVFGRHQVSFRPTHQMILITNKKPHAAATDYALWQRLQLIPFTLSFVEEPTADYERQVDEKLPKKLENEASGILAWLVKGCLAWQREGLKPPRAVRAATEDYRNKEDAISRFISEGCVKGPAFSAAVNQLYEACKKWVEENDLSPVTLKRLSRELQERGYERDDTGRTVYFRGIGIREETHAQ